MTLVSHLAMVLTNIHTTLKVNTRNRNKSKLTNTNYNPGLVASYDIRPGNGSGLF